MAAPAIPTHFDIGISVLFRSPDRFELGDPKAQTTSRGEESTWPHAAP